MSYTHKIRFRESYDSPIGKTDEHTTSKKTYLDESVMGRWGICQTLNYWKNEVISQYLFIEKTKNVKRLKLN